MSDKTVTTPQFREITEDEALIQHIVFGSSAMFIGNDGSVKHVDMEDVFEIESKTNEK